jgi:hypothetical protein
LCSFDTDGFPDSEPLFDVTNVGGTDIVFDHFRGVPHEAIFVCSKDFMLLGVNVFDFDDDEILSSFLFSFCG